LGEEIACPFCFARSSGLLCLLIGLLLATMTLGLDQVGPFENEDKPFGGANYSHQKKALILGRSASRER
jgi:hypothetical protein